MSFTFDEVWISALSKGKVTYEGRLIAKVFWGACDLQSLTNEEIQAVAGDCMSSATYELFMTMVRAKLMEKAQAAIANKNLPL